MSNFAGPSSTNDDVALPSETATATGSTSQSQRRNSLPDLERLALLDGTEDEDGGGSHGEDSVHFVLLAEFDIDAGATLSHQYPYPTGTDEHRLAELMLPDGAHLRGEDWTIFYLGQTASSAVAPMFSHEELRSSANANATASTSTNANLNPRASMMLADADDRPKRGSPGGGLLYVLNCVRCKEDKTVRRGAQVKAMAIATHHPYIQIYKPLLLLGLEEYFRNPGHDVLQHIYDTCNSINLLSMPNFGRYEKILLHQWDRKDMFPERFETRTGVDDDAVELASISSHHANAEGKTSRKGSESSSYVNAKEDKKGAKADNKNFETSMVFRKISMPLKVPTYLFDEDVGEYSVIELVNAFKDHPPFAAPYHPHLRTNGAATPPIILIINAILANKRVLFLGSGGSHTVAKMVLAASSIASGGGQVLRGIVDTAFPYANLASIDILEEFPGYIAGVANPRFEDLHTLWDVLCNIDTGKVTVSKHMAKDREVAGMRSGRSSETSLGSVIKVEEGEMAGTPQSKMTSSSKADSVDNVFIDEIHAAIASHYGESHIRLRFAEWLSRFTRLAADQECRHTGSTKIGFPTRPFRDGALGSGAVFSDDATRQKEMWANGHRIDAWRRTKGYKTFAKDFVAEVEKRRLKYDVQHQISRLRMAKGMSAAEADAIFATFAEIEGYEETVELLSYLPPHAGGITPIANGLFHRLPSVREDAVTILSSMQRFNVGRLAVASLNYFHRKAYLQLLERRGAPISPNVPE
ncbi:hypothetical protein EHS25_002505 [Saitozyma podzolica]|uniref:UDENN domain-containing protein n=1 Tax=Saitozyma podzolica TaxID=1890683 RepID=A0A427YED0_9TREE|nr:hypothetical protein EHS25_002505 [Saitozyma podzolica]